MVSQALLGEGGRIWLYLTDYSSVYDHFQKLRQLAWGERGIILLVEVRCIEISNKMASSVHPYRPIIDHFLHKIKMYKQGGWLCSPPARVSFMGAGGGGQFASPPWKLASPLESDHHSSTLYILCTCKKVLPLLMEKLSKSDLWTSQQLWSLAKRFYLLNR